MNTETALPAPALRRLPTIEVPLTAEDLRYIAHDLASAISAHAYRCPFPADGDFATTLAAWRREEPGYVAHCIALRETDPARPGTVEAIHEDKALLDQSAALLARLLPYLDRLEQTA